MNRFMFKFIAAIMLLAWSLEHTNFFSLKAHAAASGEFSSIDEHLDNVKQDCDDPASCQDHCCHLGHCLFLFSREPSMLCSLSSKPRLSSSYAGTLANGVHSVLLEPPCA